MKIFLFILLFAAVMLAPLAFFSDIKVPVDVTVVSSFSDGTMSGTHSGGMRHYTRELSLRPVAVVAFVCDIFAIVTLVSVLARSHRA